MPMLSVPAVAAGSMAARRQPELASDGVTLRPWQAVDLDAVVTAYADPGIQRWHCRSMDAAEARDWIAGWAEQWRAETGASWAVTVDGRVAGQVGLRHMQLFDGLAGVSYWVLPAARGRHVAPRALTALTHWSFAELGLHRIEVAHSTVNLASCRVAERAGFPAEGTRRSEARHADGWHDMHQHVRIREDSP